ncbi:hypothetical protein [Billgrantia desiderata]|uniref:hypothetical protein n=1 Tax=Billgrantia desiderata TaxID=52021 RepID=UPI00111D1630|nr:hypothetical protein [Halomonas desiderata]
MDDATVAEKEKKEKIRNASKHEIIKSSRLFIVTDLVDTGRGKPTWREGNLPGAMMKLITSNINPERLALLPNQVQTKASIALHHKAGKP